MKIPASPYACVLYHAYYFLYREDALHLWRLNWQYVIKRMLELEEWCFQCLQIPKDSLLLYVAHIVLAIGFHLILHFCQSRFPQKTCR